MMTIKRFFLVWGTLMLVSSAHAQGEPYWRVDGDTALSAIPEYDGQPSPFPFVELPKEETEVVEETPKVVYDPEIAMRDLRNKKTAEVLSEIRDLISSEGAFNPDLSHIKVAGVLKGPQKASALIDDEWVKEGQVLRVPPQAIDQLLSLADYLETLNPSIASSIRAQIDSRISEINAFELTLVDVSKDGARLKDIKNRQYVILFEQQS